MKKSVLFMSAVLLVTSTMVFASSLQSLNKAQVIKTLQGKTITTIPLITLDHQMVTNTFTGYFDKNGQIQGQLSSKPENAPQNDQGVWTVKSDGKLCNTWKNWDQGKPICVTMYKLNNGILFINEDKKLETLILNENIVDGNHVS